MQNAKSSRKDFVAENYREAIVAIAQELLDKPSVKYRPGHPELGQSPVEGFDCSGFVGFVLRAAGLTIPDYIGQDGVRRPIRHTNEYWDAYGIAKHEGLQAAGDLLFFSRTGRFPTHIGIVRDEETYIHAPGQYNTSVEIAAIVQELIVAKGDKGIIYSRNPIGFKSPSQVIQLPTYRYHQTLI